MNALAIGRHALCICLALASAGCGSGSQPTIASRGYSVPLAKPLSAYTSIYSFQPEPDGQNPEARMIPFFNSLYGTTSVGGTGCGGKGCGTVFRVTTAGAEKVLYRFKGPPDGLKPLAELVAFNALLYGTTYQGGVRCKIAAAAGCGTVFSIDRSGSEHVLYQFKGNPDGASPQGPLTLIGDTLYGTTRYGGTACTDYGGKGCGTVFSIDKSGRERVLYRFKGKPDGADPTGNLYFLYGTLFGTTLGGGYYGSGSVFTITPSASERVVYSSGTNGPYDMYSPSGLASINGELYGSAAGGSRGGGAVYAVTPTGYEHIVYSFNQNQRFNGDVPEGRLIGVNGLLYGTTVEGGEHAGYGVVFSLSTSGNLRVLYRFTGPPDGSYPVAGVSDAKGTLFGTTTYGGKGCRYYCQRGYGTIFRLTR